MSEQVTFKHLAAALHYLQQHGYKIKKTKIYKDRDQGLIRVAEDGSVSLADVLDYSLTLGPSKTPAEIRLKAALVELKRQRGLFDVAEELIIKELNQKGCDHCGCDHNKSEVK